MARILKLGSIVQYMALAIPDKCRETDAIANKRFETASAIVGQAYACTTVEAAFAYRVENHSVESDPGSVTSDN